MINQNAKQAEFFAKRIEELLIEIYSSFIINKKFEENIYRLKLSFYINY